MQKTFADFTDYRPSTSPISTFRFDGNTYNPEYDDKRLTGQLLHICNFMKDGACYTLQEIQSATFLTKMSECSMAGGNIEQVHADPESSISAQLRHLRKDRFGSYSVNKQSRGDRRARLYEYQLIVNKVEHPESEKTEQPEMPRFFTKTQLLKRNWTPKLIKLLLQSSDYEEEKPHATFGAPMQLSSPRRVWVMEQCPEDKDYQQKRKQKKTGGVS